MTKPTLSTRDPSLDGLRVLVVGLGRSGLAAARLALSKGALVRVADRRDEQELELAGAARDLGARVNAGGHPAELAADADLVVVSPGVPTARPSPLPRVGGTGHAAPRHGGRPA